MKDALEQQYNIEEDKSKKKIISAINNIVKGEI
jgi:hypothetical protein